MASAVKWQVNNVKLTTALGVPEHVGEDEDELRPVELVVQHNHSV